jgi:hypothetical protein
MNMTQPQSEMQGAGQAPRTKWPLIIGIISIAFASLAIICTPASLAMHKLNPQSGEVFKGMPVWFEAYMTASCVVGVLMGIVLLAAGIMLVLRKPAARPLHLGYACLAVVVCLIGLAVSVLAFSGSGMEGPAKVGMYVGFACSVPLGLAYPIFLLIWFLRGSIAREVAGWRGGALGNQG